MGSTICISDSLREYIIQHGVSESASAESLRLLTGTHERGGMASSAEQVQLICLLIRLTKAKRLIEVGVYTGYSTLRMAEILPDDGMILACDVTDEWLKLGQPYWQEAGVTQKIKPIIAPAAESMQGLLSDGKGAAFDLIYIDADKENYPVYYELAYQLVRPGGLIIIDNTLWGGKVLDAADDSVDTQAICSLNKKVNKDARVERAMLPIGDGVTVIMKNL